MPNDMNPLASSLLAHLQRQYKTEQRTLELPGTDFYYWAPQDIEELIREVTENDFCKDERLPYWSHLWPSAICLQQFLDQHSVLWAGKRVLELGCGLGMNSFFLYRKSSLLLSIDYEPTALRYARLNFLINSNPVPMSPASAPLCAMDWRQPALKGRFDILIGSDVLYEQRFFTPIQLLIQEFMNPQAKLIFSEPGRTITKSFCTQLHESGWSESQYLMPFHDKKSSINQQIVIHLFQPS